MVTNSIFKGGSKLSIMNDIAFSNNREIPFTLFKNENQTDTLAIILPGIGYTTQAPLLYYSRNIFYHRGYDVLQVNYRYIPDIFYSISEEEFTNDVEAVIEKVFTNHSYSNYIIIAKSIGTIALSYLLDKPTFKMANAIWLTPLLKRTSIYNALLKNFNKGLCIIGDNDHHYVPERFEEIKRNQNMRCMLIEGVDHGLEDESDLTRSLDVLKSVLMEIKEF